MKLVYFVIFILCFIGSVSASDHRRRQVKSECPPCKAEAPVDNLDTSNDIDVTQVDEDDGTEITSPDETVDPETPVETYEEPEPEVTTASGEEPKDSEGNNATEEPIKTPEKTYDEYDQSTEQPMPDNNVTDRPSDTKTTAIDNQGTPESNKQDITLVINKLESVKDVLIETIDLLKLNTSGTSRSNVKYRKGLLDFWNNIFPGSNETTSTTTSRPSNTQAPTKNIIPAKGAAKTSVPAKTAVAARDAASETTIEVKSPKKHRSKSWSHSKHHPINLV